MTKNRNSNKRATDTLVIWVIVGGFFASMVALISLTLGTAPWDIQWIESGSINYEVLLTLDTARHEVSAALLVTLNCILFVLRRRHRLSTSPARVPIDAASRGANTDNLRSDERGMPTDTMSVAVIPDFDLGEALGGQRWGLSHAAGAMSESSEHPSGHELSANNAKGQNRIATDETARLKRELKSCQQQLEIANQAKVQFLANMSHELRTPMNGIMGMTDLLMEESMTARQDRFVQSISSSASTLLGIINDLLDFSKIDSGILQLEHGRFSVRDCVEDVCTLLAGQAQFKNIELICHVDDSVPEQMEGDPSRVRQILNNLVTNAIAFTHEGEVVVRLKRSDTPKRSGKGKSTYQCDVQDTGVGISPELQLELFEAFTQSDVSNTRAHGGLGMGLAIARQLVSLMNGGITFRSRLGQGTCISFSMELDDVGDTEDVLLRRRPLHGARVLVVDDNKTNRTILYHQLSNWGLIVETVVSGKLAMEALRAAHDRGQGFEVLILDLHMPEMDGIQLAKAIQLEADFQHIRSIMLTSTILQFDAKELRRLGIHKYVSKPASQAVLHDSLASLMPLLSSEISGSGRDTGSLVPDNSVFSARVLLVEDNPVNQDVAMGMLQNLGCDVELATDGEDALAKGEVEKYDIVLMDCQMPRMDGYEATRLIKSGESVNAATPIVALTANAMDGDRERCLLAGMDDYVAKPVRTQILSHMIEKWVRKPLEVHNEISQGSAPTLLLSGANEGELASGIVSSTSVPALINGTPEQTETLSSEVDRSSVSDESQLQDVGVDIDETLINLKAINIIRELQRPGKPDLVKKVVGVYLDKTPQVIEDMCGGVASQDYAVISACAHSLKSSSAYLGADVLSVLCKEVESAIAGGTYDDLDELINSIAEGYQNVAGALAELTHTDQAA